MAKEKCVICGSETDYDETTNINQRYNYVEGCGQLCEKCYNGVYDKKYGAFGRDGLACDCVGKKGAPGWNGYEEKCMSADSEIEEKCISVPFDMIKNTPEDNDLGWLVRKMYTGR